MAPIDVTKTYKRITRKRARPGINIRNILSDTRNKQNVDSISVFDALFSENIKHQKRKKQVENKENKVSLSSEIPKKVHVITGSSEESHLESTFDRVLTGPIFQNPTPLEGYKSCEFDTSSSDFKTSASDSSFNTLFSVSKRPTKKPVVVRRDHPVKSAHTLGHIIHPKMNTEEVNSCLTSTPKSCKNEKNYPLLSPIPQSKRIKKKNIDKENASQCSDTELYDSNKNSKDISFKPELFQSDYSQQKYKCQNIILDEPISTHQDDKFSRTKHESPADSVLIKDVDNLSQSFKGLQVNTESCTGQPYMILSNNKDQVKPFTFISEDDRASCIAFRTRIKTAEQKSVAHENDCTSREVFCSLKSTECIVNDIDHCVIKSVLEKQSDNEVEQDPKTDLKNLSVKPTNKYMILSNDKDQLKPFISEDDQARCITYQTRKRTAEQKSIAHENDCTSREVFYSLTSTECIVSDIDHCVIKSVLEKQSNSEVEQNPKTDFKNLSGKPKNESIILFDSWNSTNYSTANSISKDFPDIKFNISSMEVPDCVNSTKELDNHTLESCKSTTEKLFLQTGTQTQIFQDSEDDIPLIYLYPQFGVETSASSRTSSKIAGSCKFNMDRLPSDVCLKTSSRNSLRRLSCRRLSHQVVPNQALVDNHLGSPSFRDVYGIPSRKTVSTPLSEVSIAESHEDWREKFTTIDETEEELNDISLSDGSVSETSVLFTAQDAVMQQCHQTSPIPFSEAFPSRYWEICRKIGEGVYGEVFMSEGMDSSVLKIIPIEGSVLVNGEPQKKFEEILSEIVIAMELSNLRKGKENRTDCFSEMKRCLCVQGEYPQKLIELWDVYDEAKGSENDSPTMFKEDQLYIILELANGGHDLEAYQFTTAEQSYALFLQISYALAVAEQALEFEHRDLHWGNVLISPTSKKEVSYTLCGKEFIAPTNGVQVAIIDFTLSRMSYDGCCIYNDLSRDPSLFTAKGDYQFEIYRLMQQSTSNTWDKFVPYTNLLWLHYLNDKMCTMVKYTKRTRKSHKEGLKMLEKIQKMVLRYNSALDFVLREF